MNQVLRTLLVIGLLAGTSHQAVAADAPGHVEFGDEAYNLLKLTFSYDPGVPINARTAGMLKNGGHTFERLVFDSFHYGAVPGLLAKPNEGEGPFPVVLLLHGLGGNKEQWLQDAFTNGGDITHNLLDRGYAVLALDAQYHGDRAVYNDYVNPAEMIFQRGWAMRYSNMMAQTIVDYRRAIDYLATRADIDTERVGILGYSMGAHMTFILGAVEPRIKAAVACVVPDTPGMPSAAYTFAREMGNDPLLMMMGRKDRFYTVEQAQALFDRVPGDNKSLQFFDSGHSLPKEYTRQAVDWLQEKL